MRHILPDLFGGCSLCQQPWPYHCFNLYSHRWRMDRSECGNNQRPNIPVSEDTTQRRNKIPIGPSSYGPSPYFSFTTRQVTLLADDSLCERGVRDMGSIEQFRSEPSSTKEYLNFW